MRPLWPDPAVRELGSRLLPRLLLLVLGAGLFVAGIRDSIPIAVLFGSVLFVASATVLWYLAQAVRREHVAQVETGWLTQQPESYPVSALGDTLRTGLVADPPEGFRAIERRAVIGTGRETFERAVAATLRWEVKTRAGFRVIRVGDHGAFFSGDPVRKLECAIVKLGPIRETVRVVRIIEEPRLRGFAYGTLPEHPLRGEEAFVVEWRADDAVELVIRSFSRPSTLLGWLAYPILLLAQRIFIRRYLRVLLE